MLFLLVGLAGLVVALDQGAKFIAFKQEMSMPIFNGMIEIVHAKNEGIAFGIGSGLKHGGTVLSIMSVITVGFLLIYYFRFTHKRRVDTVAISLIIGGAVGNLIDRILNNGKVLDFIQLRFINWPAFNFADISIVAGVVLLIIAIAFDNAESSTSPSVDKSSGS